MSTKIIFLLSLVLDETYAVFKISFARLPYALGAHMGPDMEIVAGTTGTPAEPFSQE